MHRNIFRLVSDISRATDGGMPELQVDFVYFPQEIANDIIRDIELSELSCKYCGQELNPRNLRAIVRKNGEQFAVCKELTCSWKYVWEQKE
ncbi:hypothetical protein IPdc08_00464 [archaeon]|nr:hypothetical protein IPdc08_00464 [archaeon]